jgi:hypothetical protein
MVLLPLHGAVAKIKKAAGHAADFTTMLKFFRAMLPRNLQLV